ncbi:MAG: DUF2378 family protein [Archangium sp.]
MSSQLCRHIVFEALFIHGLKGEFNDALKSAGFDAKAPLAEYPLTTFGACLDVVAASPKFAALPRDDAYRKLGTMFIEGILATMLGKVVGVAILLSGPERTGKKVPSLIKSDYGVSSTFRVVEKKRFEMASEAGVPLFTGPYFAGIMEEAIRRARGVPNVTCRSENGSFVLDYTWE